MISSVPRLFHIALISDWELARQEGVYRMSTLGKRLDQEGFIHLSFADQVKMVADHTYRGRADLLLLEIDEARLNAPVRLEAVADADQPFPHLYGELALDAVLTYFSE